MAFTNPFKGLPTWGKWTVLAGGILVTGGALVKHHKATGSWSPFSASQGSGSQSPTMIDPVTGMTYSQDNAIDPMTGLSYLAEAQQYGSVQAAEAAVSSFGASYSTGSGIPVNPVFPSVSPSPPGSAGTAYTSDAAWSQAVQAGLTDIGYNSTEVATALGLYLTQQPVSQAQAHLIDVAIAEFGPPPVGNFQVIQAPVPQPKPPAGNTKTSVPYVTGMDLVEAQRDISYAGLQSSFTGPAFKAGQVRIIASQSPAGGIQVNRGTNVKLTYRIGK